MQNDIRTHGPAKILVCDDDVILAGGIARTLRRRGYEVESAVAADQAVEISQRFKPDLILMDIKLEGEADGIAAVERIGLCMDVPVVYISAYSEKELVDRIKTTNPYGYLRKPVDQVELNAAVEIALYKHQADRLVRESEERLRGILGSLHDLVFVLNKNGIFTDCYFPPGFQDLLWMPPEAFIGRRFHEVLPEDVAELLRNRVRSVEHRGGAAQFDYSMIIQGKPRWFNAKVSARNTATGDFDGVTVVCLDITDRKEAEAEVIRSEEELRLSLDATTDGIWKWNFKEGVLDYSPNYYTMLGYRPGEFLPTYENWVALLHPDDRPGAVLTAERYIETKPDNYLNQFRMRTKSGDYRWIRAKARVVERDGKGEAIRIIGSHEDITDRKDAYDALRASEQRFRIISETIDEIFWMLDLQRNAMSYVGPAYEKVWGRPVSDLHENLDSFIDSIHKEDRARVFAVWERMKTFQPFEHEYRIVRPDGEIRWIWDRGFPARDHVGRVTGYVGIAQDISERKITESLIRIRVNLLEYSATHPLGELLRKTLDEVCALTRSPIGFYHFIEEDERTILLQAWSTRTVEEFCSAGGAGSHYSLDQAGVWVDAVKERRPVIHNDYSSLPHRKGLPEGHAPVVRELVAPIMRSDRIKAILGVGNKPSDYTQRDLEIVSYLADVAWEMADRKRAETALRESDERFRLTFQTSPDSININRLRDGLYIDVNEGFTAIMGYTREEIIGKTSVELNIWHDPGDRRRLVEGLRKEGYVSNLEAKFRAKDGALITGLMSARVILLKGEPHIVSITRDIEEWKRTQEALRESEQRYRALFEESVDGVYSVLRDGAVTDANTSFCKLFGYTREEMLGKDVHELYMDPSDRPMFQREIEKYGFVRDYELGLRKSDGREVDTLVSSSVIWGKNDEIVGYRGIVRDLTLRKELQKQLRQAQKMESIGALAGGIAHDFNNLLQVVLGYSDMLLSGKTRQDPAYKGLLAIQEAARSGADLVKGLMAVSRNVEPNVRPVDLNHEIARLDRMLWRTLSKVIRLEMRLAEDLKTINADPGQMSQLFLNLAVNAQHAMPNGGTLTIQTANARLDREYCRTHLDMAPGEYVVITVSDTGHGMEKEVIEHIFEPFYTTKGPGEGTGLGLATVYGIVKSHKGHITCHSEPRTGTTFKMYFPVVVQEIPKDADAGDEKPVSGTETILLVDDEEHIRKFGEEMFGMGGYHVLTAANGREAVEVYRSHKETIALVILDLIMPEMDGRRCLRELLKINPMVKVIVAHGCLVEGSFNDVVDAGAKRILNKPYRIKEILSAVREVLDESSLGSGGAQDFADG